MSVGQNRRLWLIGLSVALLACGGVLFVFLGKHKPEKKDSIPLKHETVATKNQIGVLITDSVFVELPQPKQMITTGTLAEITDGDYVLPRFSPDGRYLAYSQVLVEQDDHGINYEYTAVWLYDTVIKQTVCLLDQEQANEYGASFVFEFEWIDNQKVLVKMSDGDVNGIYLTFDVISGKVLKKKYYEEDDAVEPEEKVKQALAKTMAILPGLDRSMMESVLNNSHASVILPDTGVVYQKNDDIWLVDYEKKENRCLAKLPSDCIYEIIGGFSLGDELVFLIHYVKEDAAKVYRIKNGNSEIIADFSGVDNPGLEVKHTTQNGVFFIAKQKHISKESQNPLYYYDGKKLSIISDCDQLCDVDISADGQKIAFCYWKDKKRVLRVKELE